MEAGILRMSQKERDRLRVLEIVRSGKIKLVKAADLLMISYRHCKRIYKRFREEGDEGLVHRSRGRKSWLQWMHGRMRIRARSLFRARSLWEMEIRARTRPARRSMAPGRISKGIIGCPIGVRTA